MADSDILKGGGAESNVSALLLLLQKHTTNYMPFKWEKAAFKKIVRQLGCGPIPSLKCDICDLSVVFVVTGKIVIDKLDVSVILAAKVELYVGDASTAIDGGLPSVGHARFTRLGWVLNECMNLNIHIHCHC